MNETPDKTAIAGVAKPQDSQAQQRDDALDALCFLAETTARQTVNEFDRRRRKQDAARILHNTTILMEHYAELQQFPQSAISETAEARAVGADIEGDAYLESVRTSKAKTAIMIAHINTALMQLERDAHRRGIEYKLRAFKMKYIDGKTFEEIAEEMNSGKNSPARWCKEINELLSVKIFGIDGLRRW